MKTIKVHLSCACALLFICAHQANATVIGSEDFDGGATNLSGTVNVFEYGDGTGGASGDVFGRVSNFSTGGTGMPFDVADDTVVDMGGGGVLATDSRGLIGQNATAIFAVVDADGGSMPSGPLNDAVWTFDISSAISITDITIDIGAMGDFEEASTDGFRVEAQIDGGGYTQIFLGRTFMDANNVSRTYRPMDIGTVFSENDPLELSIDGVATGTLLDKSDPNTGLFDSFTSVALAGQSGSTLDVRIGWDGSPSGSEAMGFDNITINGTVPEPSTGIFALLGLMGMFLIRRK
jgi:hypothetical protein